MSHWDTLPLALTDGRFVRAVTAESARHGLRAGMTVTEAESRSAALQVLPWDQVAIDEAVRRATASFLAASPQVTPVAGTPGLWWVGASGFDSSGGEPALADSLLAMARAWHPGARVAIADSCVAARVGTWESRGPITLVPPGTDARYLATAPLGLLPMDPVMREALAALGIRAGGGLAALPPDDVEQRWGRTGLQAWRLARGEDRRRPGLTTADHPRSASADLVPSVATTEPVLFLLRAAVERLLRALVADGRAVATLAITLTLDDGRGATGSGRAHTITREVRLEHPLARLVPLFERCRALLDRWPLPAPVCGVTVAIAATAPLSGEQGDLLDPAWRDPAAADAAFARLRVTLGADAIVVPAVADTHRPERAGRWSAMTDSPPALADQRPPSGNGKGRHPSPIAASRLLDPPEPVDVECDDRVPRVLRWRGQRLPLADVQGPERLAGDWWADAYARDYWRCGDPDGDGTLILYHDRSSGSGWFVQGWED